MESISIFQGHTLKPIHQYPIFRNGDDLMWPSLFLLLVFACIVWVRVGMRSKFDKIMLATFSLQATRQIEREDFNPFKPLSLLLTLIFCSLASFFVYQVNKNLGSVFENKPQHIQFLSFFTIILFAFILKNLFSHLMGQLTETGPLFNEYLYSNLLINQTTGIIVFPFLVITELSQLPAIYLLLPCLLIFSCNLLLKWFRGVRFSAFEQRIGFLQIFIYFCAVEILPNLVLIKFIIVNF